MAAIDRAPQTNSSEQTTAHAPLLGRDRLARLVVIGSFLTLFLLVSALIGLAQSDNTTASDSAKNAFSAILPVLAGWVGTVLAFYFSAASQERTSASLDKVISRSGGGPGPSTLVSRTMIAFSSIAALQKLEDKDGSRPKDISISKLQQAFEQALPNGTKVTRLLFVDSDGVFKYVLHIGTLNAFIVKQQVTGGAATFADMLADPETLHQISKLVVFVSASASLGDAKGALEKVRGAQDIIVTAAGNATEPMLGWLSNVDLIKALQAN